MMKRFEGGRLAAVVAAVLVGCGAARAAFGADQEPPPLVGWMELSGELSDGETSPAFVASNPWSVSLRRVVKRLEDVAVDPRYLGVVIYLDQADLTLAQINEISEAVRSARAAGRKVLVYAQRYDLLSYTLACAADKILLQHKGVVEIVGVHVEEMYLLGLLEKVGLKADLLQIGRFKGAQEPLTASGPSDAWNETMDGLLSDIYGLVLDQITQGRGLSRDEVEDFFGACLAMTDEQYRQQGVVDHLTDRDLTDVTAVEFGFDFQWHDLLDSDGLDQAIENPFALFRLLFKEPTFSVKRPSLAVVHASGPIVSGDSQSEGAFGGRTIGSRTIVGALRDARDHPMIKGVLMRVDSPGGSALASEVIWQAVRDLAATKPVFVSIGSTAASGGYYIASAADQIYASGGSVVGSIGVVGGKIILGSLYEKIGVRVHQRSRGPLGGLFNSVEPFTDHQRAVVEASFQRVYDQFAQRVSAGRGDQISDIEKVARGRLFTGRMALRNGLVDRVGGMETALTELAGRVDLKPGGYDIVDLPPPQSLSQLLEQWLRFGGVRSVYGDTPVVRAAAATLGDRGWRNARAVLTALTLLRSEPVLTLMPSGIVVR